jgi:acyl-CoA synthetase (AMP-forming)/AMP-acid ligase II
MSEIASEPISIVDSLTQWTALQPNKMLYTFLDDNADKASATITYVEMNDRSTRIAAHLIDNLHLTRGSTVLLVYPPCLDFIVVFMGCLKAGVIAVPVYPPNPTKLNKDLKMFNIIAESSGAKIALTSSLYNYASKLATVANMVAETITWPQLKWDVTDSILSSSTVPHNQERFSKTPPSEFDSVAFLQYTSGSTADPKGVMITYRNIAHNCHSQCLVLGSKRSSVGVSWLPQYHDMGLIGAYLNFGIYCGGQVIWTSPITFIKDPATWVRTLSRFKATHSPAPNFAYTLTARKFMTLKQRSQMKGFHINPDHLKLDLSSMEHIVNGGN